MTETKRLAIIITQKEHCANTRLIEAPEKQRCRTVRSIIVEHEKRGFVESGRAFHQFALAMFELLNAAGLSVESLASERSLVVRLEALGQQGIIPSYGHYGLEQHFDLTWRRARTYPARTRLPAPADNDDEDEDEGEDEAGKRPAFGLSRTRCRMFSKGKRPAANKPEPIQELDIDGLTQEDDEDGTFIDVGDDDDDEPAQPQPDVSSAMLIDGGINNLTPVAAVVAQDPEPVASSIGQYAMATGAVVSLEARVYHHLRLNGAEGTSLEGTNGSSIRGIRYWLNTTRVYGPMLGVIRGWFWRLEKRNPQWPPRLDSETSWPGG